MPKFSVFSVLLWVMATSLAEGNGDSVNGELPVCGLHVSVPSKRDLPRCLTFIREVLPKQGVNTLIVEFNYGYDYKSLPEFSNPSALDLKEVRQIVEACKAGGIELIPQINCLGHQSWGERTGPLLAKHPEFDETPGKYPKNEGIYCRSYCPLHPDVHRVVFALIDELAKACEAKSFHVGMDEVFLLGDKDCARCGGKDAAELFASEVNALHKHLKSIGCQMWMWSDRFLDGKETGIGKWEASENGTHKAIDLVSKDIVMCDWHYEKAHETPRFFAEKGFRVVACPWRKSSVALGQLALIRGLREEKDKALANRGLGMVQTTWCGFRSFIDAYDALGKEAPAGRSGALESARCFQELFEGIGSKK
jgi:hypothetical protein